MKSPFCLYPAIIFIFMILYLQHCKRNGKNQYGNNYPCDTYAQTDLAVSQALYTLFVVFFILKQAHYREYESEPSSEHRENYRKNSNNRTFLFRLQRTATLRAYDGFCVNDCTAIAAIFRFAPASVRIAISAVIDRTERVVLHRLGHQSEKSRQKLFINSVCIFFVHRGFRCQFYGHSRIVFSSLA